MEKDLFLKELEKIEYQYQEEQNKHKSFNIVRALHKIDDERRLHSRFIAYLLSPESKHGMGDVFLKKFVQEAKLKEFSLVGKIEVFPNEEEKSEKQKIDILIVNKDTNQVIIIENKINAKDSNHKNNQEQDYQLDTYQPTSESNDDIAQLKAYFEDFKENNDLEIKYNDDNEAKQKIQLVYLTLNKKEPSLKDQFEGFNLSLIDYRTEIKHWLEVCINDKTTDLFLVEILRQYLNVTIQLTNDVDRAKKLQKLISDYIDSAWKNKEKVFELRDFKHVKWHTVFDFWKELTDELEKNPKAEIIKRMTNEKITKQTHKEENKRIDRKSYGIVIKIGETSLYITNDNNNGLTFGLEDAINKVEGKDWFKINEDIKFSKFSDEATFTLINNDKREGLIVETIEKIKEFTDKI